MAQTEHYNETGFHLSVLRITLAIMAFGVTAGSDANLQAGDTNEKVVSVTHVEEGDQRFRIVARNRSPAEVALIVTLTLTNMVSSNGDRIVMNLLPESETNVTTLSPKDAVRRTHCTYNKEWKWGRLNSVHDKGYVYQFPFAPRQSYEVGQAYNGNLTHKGWMRYAIDFRMPEGTPVHAAREGVVVDVVEKFSKGGTSTYYSDKGNSVRILHSDGTIGRYLHLLKNGADVEVGQIVKRGQRIGLSGNTGRSWRPHLHFHVRRITDQGARETVPTCFATAAGPQYLRGYRLYSRHK